MVGLRSYVKAKLKAGKPALGVSLSVMNPELIRTISNSGFDWVLYDTEHGPWSIAMLQGPCSVSYKTQSNPELEIVLISSGFITERETPNAGFPAFNFALT